MMNTILMFFRSTFNNFDQESVSLSHLVKDKNYTIEMVILMKKINKTKKMYFIEIYNFISNNFSIQAIILK